jgi:hypothetical protein
MAKTTLEVADNVSLNRDGKIYRAGDVFGAEKDDEIERWLALGYVSEVQTRRRSTSKTTRRK